MKLVTLLLGVLAVGAVALVISVVGYARQGSATHASRLALSAPVATPNASPSPSPAEPGSVGPSVLLAAPPDSAAVGSGPVAVAAPSVPQGVSQNEAPPASGQSDSAAAPSSEEHHHSKDHGGGHGKHDHSAGG